MRRHKHNLTHYRNSSCKMGNIVPVGVAEVIRGDTFKHSTSMFMRLAPMVTPLMHPVHAHIHHVYFPFRILMDKWEDFITGGEDFDDATALPHITFDGVGSNPPAVTAGSLANHLGLPVGFNGTAYGITALIFRAYAMWFNENIRDDQIQDKVGFSTADGSGGPDIVTNTDLLNCNWAKDPFVAARPDDQLGAEVTLPLGNQAPVAGIATAAGATFPNDNTNKKDSISNPAVAGNYSAVTNVYAKGKGAGSGDLLDVYADLSQATGATINELRLAIATQQWQERINRSGNKYQDYLRRYGIRYSDARIDRPEYLGGGKQTIQFSEVIQTAEGADPVGSLKGHGIAALRSNNYVKFFEEDGIVLTFLTVKPIPMYLQALPRWATYQTKEDFYQKEYEMLGMQEITNKEVKFDHSAPDGTFAYQPRFDHLRRIPNTLHGQFSDRTNTEFMAWHAGRDLGAGDVALNDSFVKCTPSVRHFADQVNDHLYVTVQNKIAARRQIRKHAGQSGLTLNRV